VSFYIPKPEPGLAATDLRGLHKRRTSARRKPKSFLSTIASRPEPTSGDTLLDRLDEVPVAKVKED
jgi:hypothetical protein